jgi:glycosyltransferase involved in cell wall biosynthesis
MTEQSNDALSKRSFGSHERDQPRVAAIHEYRDDSDTLAQLRAWGVPGHELELIEADAGAERLLSALGERRYDLIHLCSTGPAAVAALAPARTLGARTLGIPVTADYGSGAHARPRARDHGIERTQEDALAAIYEGCALVLSPSRAADAELTALGVTAARIRRWAPGVDLECFSPARYHPDAIPRAGGEPEPRIKILYAGRLDADSGLELLADAFLRARERDPRLQLVLAGDGPEAQALRRQLRGTAIFLGQLHRDALASVYASADLLVLPGSREPFGRVILEAQASGLPVLAVDIGGAGELIESGRSGCLVPASAPALAAAIHGLARRPPLRERLVTGGLAAVREHSWQRALRQLADVWEAARRAAPDATAQLTREREPLHEAANAA